MICLDTVSKCLKNLGSSVYDNACRSGSKHFIIDTYLMNYRLQIMFKLIKTCENASWIKVFFQPFQN